MGRPRPPGRPPRRSRGRESESSPARQRPAGGFPASLHSAEMRWTALKCAGQIVLAARCLVRGGVRLACLPGRAVIVIIGGEHPVERSPGVGEYPASLADLGIAARAQDLRCGHGNLPDQLAHLGRGAAGVPGNGIPWRVQLVRVGIGIVPSVLGEDVRSPAALPRLRADQAFILQLLQRRVDRPRARPPDTAAPLADLLDDLVPVHRALGQQRERRRADVAALGPGASHHPRIPEPGTQPRESRRSAESRPAAESRATAVTSPAATSAPPCFLVALVPPAVFFMHCAAPSLLAACSAGRLVYWRRRLLTAPQLSDPSVMFPR